MSTNTFPRARRSVKGYDIVQVEDFLEDAKRAYAAPPGTPAVLTARQIRGMAFALRRGGYATEAVDAALERLEDAFATRERETLVAQGGQAEYYARVRGEAQEVLDRVARPDRRRFKGVSGFTRGYHRKDVDGFCERLVAYFQDGQPLSVEEVRQVTFRRSRGGYREAQVDAVLDAVVDIMLAVR